MNLTSIAVPSRPEGIALMPSRQALLIILAYVYALFPLIPTLTTAASFDFRLREGFGKWWGVYCVDRASWWRIGQSAAGVMSGTSACLHTSPSPDPAPASPRHDRPVLHGDLQSISVLRPPVLQDPAHTPAVDVDILPPHLSSGSHWLYNR